MMSVFMIGGGGGVTFAPQLRSHSSHLRGVQRGLCVDSFMLWIYLCVCSCKTAGLIYMHTHVGVLCVVCVLTGALCERFVCLGAH